jgi:hypothetical protein
LLEKFSYKVTAIEESNDIDTLRIKDLVGSLLSYEVTFPQLKNKSLALKASNGKGKKCG